MSAKIINGKIIAQKIKNKIAKIVQNKIKNKERIPCLAIILIGFNPASIMYVTNKRKACKEVGIISLFYKFPAIVKKQELLLLIHKLNKNKNIDGILIQLPIPNNMKNNNIIEYIDPNKDVDGSHPYNIGRLFQKSPILRPCTSYGIIILLQKYNINISGLNAVIIGQSIIVGRPMILELLSVGCTVTITHKLTKNIKNFTKNADLLIVAIGIPNFITDDWVKPGVIIIDVGINILNTGKLVGDVDYYSVSKVASYITPVPGGVGPMTVAILIQNTIKAYELHLTKD